MPLWLTSTLSSLKPQHPLRRLIPGLSSQIASEPSLIDNEPPFAFEPPQSPQAAPPSATAAFLQLGQQSRPAEDLLPSTWAPFTQSTHNLTMPLNLDKERRRIFGPDEARAVSVAPWDVTHSNSSPSPMLFSTPGPSVHHRVYYLSEERSLPLLENDAAQTSSLVADPGGVDRMTTSCDDWLALSSSSTHTRALYDASRDYLCDGRDDGPDDDAFAYSSSPFRHLPEHADPLPFTSHPTANEALVYAPVGHFPLVQHYADANHSVTPTQGYSPPSVSESSPLLHHADPSIEPVLDSSYPDVDIDITELDFRWTPGPVFSASVAKEEPLSSNGTTADVDRIQVNSPISHPFACGPIRSSSDSTAPPSNECVPRSDSLQDVATTRGGESLDSEQAEWEVLRVIASPPPPMAIRLQATQHITQDRAFAPAAGIYISPLRAVAEDVPTAHKSSSAAVEEDAVDDFAPSPGSVHDSVESWTSRE
jgi:hypothetical protein